MGNRKGDVELIQQDLGYYESNYITLVSHIARL